MSKKQFQNYTCSECEYQASQWLGKCPECKHWNSFVETIKINKSDPRDLLGEIHKENSSKKLSEIEGRGLERVQTKIEEFDRVVGGGLVSGSLILIGGEPGIGKSTLLAIVLGALVQREDLPCALYVSGEESLSQVAERMQRLNCEGVNLYVLHQNNWQEIKKQIKKIRPKYLVIDSIQTTVSDNVASAPGSISQIREVTHEIMNYCKASEVTTFLVGHITKEGSISGPKLLEHMVDAVIYFEGDTQSHHRILRSIKNRFGNTNEIGLFEMNENGLRGVKNAGQYFLDAQTQDTIGRALTCILEGNRALLVEAQSLVIENRYGNGKRTTTGYDVNRLSMLIAILEKFYDIQLNQFDIYLNVVGGIKLHQRESDLAIMATMISSMRGIQLSRDTVYIGEVGLTGEIREVNRAQLRIKELSQLNYRRVITSFGVANEYDGNKDIEVIGLRSAKDLVRYLSFK